MPPAFGHKTFSEEIVLGRFVVFWRIKGEAIVKFCVLASGSSGNAALLATDKTRILVDAGLSMKELAKRLASIGEDLEHLDAILITHEHSDHVSGLPVLARKLGIPVYPATVDHIQYMIIGALIIFFLIVEPNGLARLWRTEQRC